MRLFLKIFIFYILLSLYWKENIVVCNEYCSSSDGSCEGSEPINENKYSKTDFTNQILTKISTMTKVYTECPFRNCSCYLNVLESDLKPFKAGITKQMIEDIRPRGVTYVIHENKLYRDRDCLFPSRCSGIEYFIKQLLPKLKNSELIINTRDWPQINKHFQLFGPILSFSKTRDYLDIMYPAWSFWEGGPAIKTHPTGLGRWDLHLQSLFQESLKVPWGKKKSIGFFRGSRTTEKRDILILLSRKKPKLVDAQYTKNQAWKSSEDTLGEDPADVVSLEHHCQYKYLFNFRGVAASFRFKHLFLCGSLVIHVGDDWIEFFYPLLQPWVHYIPLREDASEEDIIKLITFLINHDKVAQEIAQRGQKFILDHLRFKEIKCYWRKLLMNYQKLLKYEVKLDRSLIEIK